MEDLKGRTIGVYAAGDICDAWEQAAKKEDIPVARWGARAIKEKLEELNLLPCQKSEREALETELEATTRVIGIEETKELLKAARKKDVS